MRQIIVDFGILQLGPLSIPLRVYGYGLMLVLGFLVGIALIQWRTRRVGESSEVITQCAILALIGGILGSRLAYVIQHWEKQFAHSPNPLGAMLNLTSGGLIYYGGVGLAVVVVLGYLRIKKLPIRRYLDLLAVGMMVGLAFGRAGCLMNGCCFGVRARDDWALSTRFPMYSVPLLKIDGRNNPFSVGTVVPSPVYDNQLTAGETYPDSGLVDSAGFLILPRNFDDQQVALARQTYSLPVLPAQSLGIVNALLIAGILGVFHRLRTREGEVFALMLILYPITRFVLESIRDNNRHDLLSGVLTHNQYTSIIMFLGGLGMFLLLKKLPASCGPAWVQRLAIQNKIASKPKEKSNRNKNPNR